MKIVFRSDSSSMIGSGHIMRCINLAKTFKNRKDVYFISRKHQNNINHKIRENDFKLIELPIKRINQTNRDNREFNKILGESINQDAIDTINAIKGINKKIDWLIIDHYQIIKSWETKLAKYVKNIMVIEDYNNFNHHCDLILNTNIKDNKYDLKYHSLNKNRIHLLGPEYSLIDPIYAKYKKLNKAENSKKRILVYFGSTDPEKLTEKAIKAFLNIKDRDFVIATLVPPTVEVEETKPESSEEGADAEKTEGDTKDASSTDKDASEKDSAGDKKEGSSEEKSK